VPKTEMLLEFSFKPIWIR